MRQLLDERQGLYQQSVPMISSRFTLQLTDNKPYVASCHTTFDLTIWHDANYTWYTF